MAPCEPEPVDERVTANSEADVLTDLELIAAINGGDAAAFEVLYFRYRNWVVALAFRFTGDSDAALDVLQETFLYVLRKFPGFRLTANFKTFLYPAVRNLSIAARRKAERYHASEAELKQVEDTPAPTRSSSASGELDAVLAALPEEQREVVLLRFVDGLSLGEIAEAMGIPLGTVKSRLHNALEALRHDQRTREYFEQ
jgi:RNA polymerase sigma-70 factor (ECF subfamily)